VRYTDNPHHRRAKLMTMTPKGQQALDYIQQRQARWANRIGKQHDLEQLRTAAMVLRQLRERLEQDEQDRDSSAGFDV
jgi:DNA-binding MarR family transcriptional regulator